MLAELEKNVCLNRLQNVMIQPVALSHRNDWAKFYCPTLGWEGHGSLMPNETFHPVETIQVRTRTLDDVLQESPGSTSSRWTSKGPKEAYSRGLAAS
jgi:FkbM family methyltransferase